jgi:hypothetical protein
MAIAGNQRAYLTARSGLARSGAVRSGFVPNAVQATMPGTSPSSSGGAFYVWKRMYPPTTAWTPVHPKIR